MKRVLVLMMLLTLATCEWMPLFAGTSVPTNYVIRAGDPIPCPDWFPPDADSAIIRFMLVTHTTTIYHYSGTDSAFTEVIVDTLEFTADTTIFD